MSKLIVHHKRLEIYEGCNGYYLYLVDRLDIRTHVYPVLASACMGDGVDMFENLFPGTPAFERALRHSLRHEYGTYLEAYFPEWEITPNGYVKKGEKTDVS